MVEVVEYINCSECGANLICDYDRRHVLVFDRYIREADYLALQSQRDDALKELEQMHKQYQSIDLMYDDMKTQHDELLEALKEIAEWSEKLNDEVLESHDLAVRQWRGCVAIATAAIRRVEGK